MMTNVLTRPPRYRVLDEVDRMMAMGFIEDVETILKAEEEHQVWRCGEVWDGCGDHLDGRGEAPGMKERVWSVSRESIGGGSGRGRNDV